MEILRALVKKLQAEEPPRSGLKRAAVAVIVTGNKEPKTLLIKRAEMESDPWSGQVAFPGGKAQSDKESARDTAAREAIEEVGIDLGQSKFLGYFGSFTAHTGTMQVVPSVFLLEKEARVRPNVEVRSYKWIELERLMNPSAEASYRIRVPGRELDVPALRIDDFVIWGLTHRILTSLLL